LYKAREELAFFRSYSQEATTKLSNTPFLLLDGEAGSGKTHLLCDAVENRVKEAHPSIMSFGEHFQAGKDVWEQIIMQSGLGTNYTKKRLLSELDRAGKR